MCAGGMTPLCLQIIQGMLTNAFHLAATIHNYLAYDVQMQLAHAWQRMKAKAERDGPTAVLPLLSNKCHCDSLFKAADHVSQ